MNKKPSRALDLTTQPFPVTSKGSHHQNKKFQMYPQPLLHLQKYQNLKDFQIHHFVLLQEQKQQEKNLHLEYL